MGHDRDRGTLHARGEELKLFEQRDRVADADDIGGVIAGLRHSVTGGGAACKLD
jgi:hypothetical protein